MYPAGQTFGRRPELFSPAFEVEKNAKGEDVEKELPGPCLLWRWLRAIYSKGAAPDPSRDFYLALADEPLGIPIMLMLLAILELHRPQRATLVTGFGLAIELSGTSSPTRIFLRHSNRSLPATWPGAEAWPSAWCLDENPDSKWQTEPQSTGLPDQSLTAESRLFRVIDIPFLTTLDEEGRVRREHPAEKPTRLRIERYRRIPVGDLVRWAVTPERLPAALRLAFAEPPLARRGLSLRPVPKSP